MLLLRNLLGKPHQTNGHIQIVVASRREAVTPYWPRVLSCYFVFQFLLHPETKHQLDPIPPFLGCEGSFPAGSFIYASWTLCCCLGCRERLVIQLKPSCDRSL